MRNLAILRSTDVALVPAPVRGKAPGPDPPGQRRRLYHYTIHYFQKLGRELDEYFGTILPETQFAGRKNLGINNLKD